MSMCYLCTVASSSHASGILCSENSLPFSLVTGKAKMVIPCCLRDLVWLAKSELLTYACPEHVIGIFLRGRLSWHWMQPCGYASNGKVASSGGCGVNIAKAADCGCLLGAQFS